MTLNLSVGPRFPPRLQKVAWTASEVPQSGDDGPDSHRHPSRSKRHSPPAQYDSATGVRPPSQSLLLRFLNDLFNILKLKAARIPSNILSGLPWASTGQTWSMPCCPRNPKKWTRTASAGSRSTIHVNNSEVLFCSASYFKEAAVTVVLKTHQRFVCECSLRSFLSECCWRDIGLYSVYFISLPRAKMYQ